MTYVHVLHLFHLLQDKNGFQRIMTLLFEFGDKLTLGKQFPSPSETYLRAAARCFNVIAKVILSPCVHRIKVPLVCAGKVHCTSKR